MAAKQTAKSEAEEAFARAWAQQEHEDIPPPEREFRFHPSRRWAFDFAWPDIKLAVEIEGQGRHQTFVGFRRDCDKYNTALALGWRVLRYPAADLKPSESRPEWPGGAAEWALDTLAVMCEAHE